jgi:Restriction endonuclease S subunits
MKNGARYKPYQLYKKSGVEWLGEIPEHWTVTRVGENAHLINGYPFDSARFDLNNGLPLVRIRDLQNQETQVRYAGPPIPEARIAEGDIIIGMDGDFAVARWRGGEALLNQRLCSLRPKASIAGNFLYYLLGTPLQLINDLTHSTTVKHLSSSQVTKTKFGFPPECEQRAIGEFLDRETAKIDELIAKKERLIELLEEKRAALITHAVTRGLNPDAPLRDSGIEWLGQIPAHWDVVMLKRMAQIRYGVGQPPRESTTGLPMIRATDLHSGKISTDGLMHVDPIDVPWDRNPQLKENEIIVVRSGAYTGDSAIIPRELAGAISGYDLVVTVTQADPKFLACALLSRYFLESQIDLIRLRAAQPHLNAEELGTCILMHPPIEEQHQIVDHIEHANSQMQEVASKVNVAIDTLREYRSALITAAVTGKIDVRNEVKAAV